jgi:hypothetical protein
MKRALLAVALMAASPAILAALPLPDEGWASWEVPAVEGAPDWCCLHWKRRPATRAACDLDSKEGGYGSTDRDHTVPAVRVYARFAGGKVEKIRTFGPSCEVKTATPIRDLGQVGPAESARWLSTQLPRTGERLADDTLASLSLHRGATPAMIDIATTHTNPKVRAQGWFWLSQVGAAETEPAIAAALRNEKNRHVREEAIFALSQLPGDRAPKALAEVVNDRSLPREDRKHAIFWMGQVESPLGAAYLDKLLGGK